MTRAAVTVLYGDAPPRPVTAEADGDELWLAEDDVAGVTGWRITADGACRGDRCVPLAGAGLARVGRVDIAALARRLGQPVVHDDAHGVWVFGEPAAARADALRSLVAPDFTLPDLDGRMHRLSDYRGRKVFLVSWASW